MKIKIPLSFLFVFAAMGVILFFSSSSSGITGKSTSGCGGPGCHQPDTATNMLINGLPVNGYVLGQSYNLQLILSHPIKQAGGFDLTVNGGSISPSTGSQVSGTQELFHTSPQLFNGGSATWSFTWTAPSTGVAPVVFFVAGNAVNMNNNAQNDAFDTDQFSVNAAQTSALPTITMNATSNITPTTATINALVNANNSTTTCSVEYGTTVSYGNTLNTTPSSVNGITNSAVSATLTGLLPATTYHYRLKAINSVGTSYSNDMVFNTYPSQLIIPQVSLGRFFPNPCTSYMLCELSEPSASAQLQIRNALQQLVDVPIVYERAGLYRIHTAHLPNGLYTVEVQQAQRKQIAVFLKQ